MMKSNLTWRVIIGRHLVSDARRAVYCCADRPGRGCLCDAKSSVLTVISVAVFTCRRLAKWISSITYGNHK
eukprot:6199525-Pleurochrysis_carterae.AAC.12